MQTALPRETFLWKRGILVMPKVCHQLLQMHRCILQLLALFLCACVLAASPACVQIALARETVLWKRGILVMPKVRC